MIESGEPEEVKQNPETKEETVKEPAEEEAKPEEKQEEPKDVMAAFLSQSAKN